MSELFLSVVNMSISASWLILTVLAVRFALKKAPKWVCVLLWGIVALRLLCPFSIESAASMIPSAETIPVEVLTERSFDVHTGITLVDNRVNEYLGDRYYEGVTVPVDTGVNVITALSVVWLAGIMLMAGYTAVSYWRLRRRVDTAVRLRENIFQSETVISPFVLGIIRPKVYLPFGMAEQDIGHVIAHELAHIRRRDHWWKPLGFLLLTIHWFNPLVWLGYVLLCRDIELACDEKVIKELGSEQRADYTQALLACSVNRRMIAACPLAFGEVGVKERVKSVLNYKKPAFWIILLSVLVCAAVAVCFLTNPENPEGMPDFEKVVSVSARDNEVPISDEGIARLIELLERYRKYDFPVGWDDPNLDSVPVHIVFSDGSHCLLHYYYYNGFSLEKLFNRGNFYAVLTYWASDGSVDAWKMEEDFNEDFQLWCDKYLGLTEPVSPDRMDETVPDPETDADSEAEKLYDLDEAISAAILSRYASGEPDGLICVESYKLLANEVMSGTPTYGKDDRAVEVTAYLLVYQMKFSVNNGELKEVTSRYVPAAITFTFGESGEYIFKEYDEWAEGTYSDFYYRFLFSGDWADWTHDMMDETQYVDALRKECEDKALAILNGSSEEDESDGAVENTGISYFSDIMGYNGYILTEKTGPDFSTRSYYVVDGDRQWLIAESFGFGPAEDYVLDLDGDGVTELITNVQYGGDGAARVYVYQRRGDTIYMGTFSTKGLLTFDNWGANAHWSEYDSEKGVFRLNFAQKNAKEYGVVEAASISGFEFLKYAELPSDILTDAGEIARMLRIQVLLVNIQSSPAHSSNPGDYIAEHQTEFDELVRFGEQTLRYCFSRFLDGGEIGLRGHIMAAACREIAAEWGEALVTAESSPLTGQQWFDIIKANALRLSEQYSDEEMETRYPASWLLLQMMRE